MQPAEQVHADEAITSISLQGYPLLRSGKVRDLFDLGDYLLIVATDRLSAFDVVLPTPIPGKGKTLTAISDFWFERTGDIVPGHRTDRSLDGLDLSDSERALLRDRATIVRKADRIDIECVVRAYLAGSGWKEYQASGTLAGEPLPSGLQRGDRLPELRFTPAVKNDQGHDRNITRGDLEDSVGAELADLLERRSIELFRRGSSLARGAGFVLADTKFEFGMVGSILTLIDEALTPDSSRYWDVTDLSPGSEPPSFDKQIVRDWLESTTWDKTYPGPLLPGSIVEKTRWRYLQVLERLQSVQEDGGGI